MQKSIFFLLSALAAAQISEPQAGVVLMRDGTAREVRGTAGAFVAGRTVAGGARLIASSGELTVVQDGAGLSLNGNPIDTPAGSAVVGFSRVGKAAYAWFAEAGEMRRIAESDSSRIPVDPASFGGDVVALGGDLSVLVHRSDGLHAVRIRPSDGAMESDETLDIAASAAVVLGDGTLIYADGAALAARDSQGRVVRAEAGEEVRSIALMGDGWVHARTASQSLAVRWNAGALSLFFLPEVTE